MTIKSRLVIAAAAVAALATVAPVSAQAQDHLVAQVPFEFTVGTSNLPGDTYRISRMNDHPEMLLVRSERNGAFVRSAPERLTRDDSEPSLTFHRYGDQYFLRAIRWDGSARLDLPETKAERAAAERRSDGARLRMETVVVTANER